MKLQEVEINRAEGLHLCEEIMLNGNILPKNHKLSKNDVLNLKALDVKHIFVAKPESGDIDFDTALGIVAAKICGQNLGFRIDERGFCEIVATKDGVFDCSFERINKFNRFSKYFILNTIAPLSLVKAKSIVARLEILVPIISQNLVDELIFALSGNDATLKLCETKEQTFSVLTTNIYNDDNEKEHFVESLDKLVDDYKKLNIELKQKYFVNHTIENIADELEEALKSSADIIFIIPAIRSYTDNDVIFSAINSICDEVVCSQIPLIGGSDLIIATKKNKKIICLPYNYLYIESPILDNFIKLAITKEKLYSYDFCRSENAIISDIAKIKDLNILIRDNNKSEKSASIAGIVLAAGQSKRIGKNKLLADINGEPLVIKAVRAAISAKISPVFVITGYQAPEIEAELEEFDINIIYNPNYYEGIKTSIKLGLKSIPDFCDGVMLIPADMPNITPELINKMADKFKKKQDKQLIIADKKGIKSNPVIWSKSLYNVADLVAENADIRPVFIEHSDYTTLVRASDFELLDVNFQNDLDTLLKQVKS